MNNAGVSFRRNPTTQTARWILDLHDAGKLDLDPPYQRKSVWNRQYKQFFIDSVVRNYPTQAVFLDLTIDPEKPTVYHVLDGKQRLTTLIEFTHDAFPAPESLRDLGLAGTYYSDFSRDFKVAVLNYLFTVEIVSNTSNAELNEAFDRLNRNVLQLSKQELRHAQFNGAFITKMETLSSAVIWRELGISSDSRIRRMLDVEYISEFYVVCMDGVQDGKDYLDDYYAECDGEIPNEYEADALFEATLKYITDIHASFNIKSSRFSNVADFYSLWAAITKAISTARELPEPSVAAVNLAVFEDEIKAEQPGSADYLDAARQGSNKRANRQVRATVLAERVLDL